MVTSQTSSLGQPNSFPSTPSTSKKRFKGWPKKRTTSPPNAVPITNLSPTPSEQFEIRHPLRRPIDEMEGVVREAGWAAIWLRRLNLRKKSSSSYDSKCPNEAIRPTIKTLAEQLQEAQSTPLALPNYSNV